MGYSLNKQSNRIDYNVREYICDTEADIADIPTNCAPGSTIFVIETSNLYMLNTKGEWIQI